MRRRKRGVYWLLPAVLLFLLVADSIHAGTEEGIGRVGAIESKLVAERGDGPVRLAVGDWIQMEDELRSEDRARVGLLHGLAIYLGNGTRIRVVEHNINEGRTVLELERGEVRIERHQPAGGGRLEIRTRSSTLTSKETHFYLRAAGDKIEIAVFDGEVEVGGGEGTTALKAGDYFEQRGGRGGRKEQLPWWYAQMVVEFTTLTP